MLHARLVDSNTPNPVTAYIPVNFTIAYGSGGLDSYTAYPDSGGVYSVTFFSSGAEQVQINAWDGGGYQTSSSCTLTVNYVDTSGGSGGSDGTGDSGQGPPTYNLAVWADQPYLTPGQSTTLYAHMNVAQAGIPINFSIQSGDGTLSTTSTTTDANGQASVTFTGEWNATQVNVADGWGWAPANSYGFAVNTPVPDNYALTLTSDAGAVETGQSTNLHATLMDTTTGLPVPGAMLSFSVVPGDGTLSASTVTTDSNGTAAVSITGGLNASQVNVMDENSFGTTASISVAVQGPTYALRLTAAQSTLSPGDSTLLTAQLTADGVPVTSNYPLAFSLSSNDGYLNNTPGQQAFSASTDATGLLTLPYTSGVSNCTISVWDAAGLYTSSNLTINVNQVTVSDTYPLSTWADDTRPRPTASNSSSSTPPAT